jgi:hypothetical protein
MKLNRWIITVCLLLGLIGAWLIPLRVASASIGQPDYDNLVTSLEILSTGWDQTQADQANSILSKPQYTAVDWQEFFTEYLGAHPFTNELRDYLNDPVFQWNDAAVRLNLQIGLIVPLEDTIQRIMLSQADELGAGLAANPALRETLFNCHRFLNTYFHEGLIDLAARQGIDRFYQVHINAYPRWLKNSIKLDIVTQPYVAALRAQVEINLADALPITDDRKAAIASTLDLTDAYATIWLDDSVLVLDNLGLDQTQLNLIQYYLYSLPAGLHDVRYITVNDRLGNVDAQAEWLTDQYGIDISGQPIGSQAVNNFPDDVSPFYTDAFSIDLAHKISHHVDTLVAYDHPYLGQWRDALIATAGADCHHYLNSTLGDGYFLQMPQEFYASIASQWYANTQHTLDLAIVRWREGYHDPLNQFLFFAEVYSHEGNGLSFYRMDVIGQLSYTTVRVERNDPHGRITALQTDKPYRFIYSDEGNLVDVLHFETFLPAVVR